MAQAHFRIDRVFALYTVLLALIFLIPATNVSYNGISVDEAIYVTLGRGALIGGHSQGAISWIYGSYLYPTMAVTLNHLGGLQALRTFSAVLITVAAAFVFLTTRRLFGNLSALWALVLFGLSPQSIDLGQFAVHDVPGIAFLAAAFYMIIAASWSSNAKKDRYFLIAAFGFALAVLFNYTAGLYFPALVLIGLTISLIQRQSPRPFLSWFLLPTLGVLAVYIFRYWSALIPLIQGSVSSPPANHGLVLQAVQQDLGVVLLLAAVGGLFLLRKIFAHARLDSRHSTILLIVMVGCLSCAVLAAPLYHIWTSNPLALEKHIVYSLIFLCPVAGYALGSLVQAKLTIAERWRTVYSVVGLAVSLIGLIWFVNNAINRNWEFQHSWPNAQTAIAPLHSLGLNGQDAVLAEGAPVYAYYFDFGPANDRVWSNTWYLQYHGLQGTDAMVAAIQDHYFDFVILDDYFTPETDQTLKAALTAAHYQLAVAQQPQLLSTGQSIARRIYKRPGR